MNLNNNATTANVSASAVSLDRTNSIRRSLILIPLGPADLPPVFNLALNLDGAKLQFQSGMVEWLSDLPDTAHIVQRLIRCCKHHLALVSPSAETASSDNLRKQSVWFEEVFALMPSVDQCDGADALLARLRRQLCLDHRHERVVYLLSYLGEMIGGMLGFNQSTREALTPSCRSYVILLCLSAVLLGPRQQALNCVRNGSLTSQGGQSNAGFCASISVSGGNMNTAFDALKLYQETLCHWGVATVEFEHNAIYYSGDEKPQKLKDHIERQATEQPIEVVQQTLEGTTTTTENKANEVKRMNSVTNISFDDEAQSERRNSKILTLKGVVASRPNEDEEEDYERSRTYATAADTTSLKRVPTEETIEGMDDIDMQPFKELDLEPSSIETSCRKPYVLSISLRAGRNQPVGTEEAEAPDCEETDDTTAKTEPSLVGAFPLKGGHSVLVSILGGTGPRRSWAMAAMKKHFENEEAQTFVAGKLVEDILENLDADVVCMDVDVDLHSLSQPQHRDEDNIVRRDHDLDSSATTFNRSYLLSVTFSGYEDCGGAIVRRPTTVGAFNLKDGAPIQVVISGGSAVQRKTALVEMRKQLRNEEAATFLGSKRIHDLLDTIDVSLVSFSGPGAEVKDVEDDDEEEEALSNTESATRVCVFRVDKDDPPKTKSYNSKQLHRWRYLAKKHDVLILQEAAAFLADKESGQQKEAMTNAPMSSINVMREILTPGIFSPLVDMGPAKVMVIAKENEDGTLVAQIVTELILEKHFSNNMKKIECSVDVLMAHEVALEEFY